MKRVTREGLELALNKFFDVFNFQRRDQVSCHWYSSDRLESSEDPGKVFKSDEGAASEVESDLGRV